MPLFQPTLKPLPANTNLTGLTAVVTGATAGIGLEIARQLLVLKVSTLVLAARNEAKGETVKKSFLADPTIKAANPNAVIKVMKLDTESYPSIQSFVTNFQKEFKELHILLLNAGIGTFALEFAATGHEKNMQVNYLSNAALTLALFPILEATAEKTGKPTRITWTGSRAFKMTAIGSKPQFKPGETFLPLFDSGNEISSFGRYGGSKLLGIFFLRQLVEQYKGSRVIVNAFCPGMVDTDMSDVLPFYLRIVAVSVKKLRARSTEKGAWVALNAAVVAGVESHGAFLEDMELGDLGDLVPSQEGQRLQKLLWNETIEDVQGTISIPSWVTKA
ncbi:hypothetical protein G7046_g4212 [Stylonectria norvegica]|nr:hypothetical protein G7046_g4212 [Stylonectria norvegica]